MPVWARVIVEGISVAGAGLGTSGISGSLLGPQGKGSCKMKLQQFSKLEQIEKAQIWCQDNWKWEGGTFHLLLCQCCGISGTLRSSESVAAYWPTELWGYWGDSSTIMEGAGSCGSEVTSQAVSILQSTWQKGKCTAHAACEHVSTHKRSLGIPGCKLEGETSQRGLKEEPVKQQLLL